jgi:hypothetical protein
MTSARDAPAYQTFGGEELSTILRTLALAAAGEPVDRETCEAARLIIYRIGAAYGVHRAH